MTLAQQMIVISPAQGAAPLSAEQRGLLIGKARWIRTVFDAGLATVAAICITRAAWEGLQEEHHSGDKHLLAAWVATLFRLVPKGQQPPKLVVRTSASRHSAGLMRAIADIVPPANEVDAVAPQKPLGRAIEAAFASYGPERPVWDSAASQTARDNQIIVVQAFARGNLHEFMTRDAKTGQRGPFPVAGDKAPAEYPDLFHQVSDLLDAASGQHMLALIAQDKFGDKFVSARPFPVEAGADLEAAVDRAERGIWSARQAVNSFDPARLPHLLHPRLKASEKTTPIASGLGVSPGAASGAIVFTPEDAARASARGANCILVMSETGPTDVEGMQAATGILTARGGMTSHAAVVARVSGHPCVAGVRSLLVDSDNLTCRIGETELKQGDFITIDGSHGAVYAGLQPLFQPHIGAAVSRLLDWSDGGRTIAVRTNVETLEAARTALDFGAEGIGLARSEHMFFSHERMVALRRLILSENENDREQALKGLIEYQAGDYAALFAAMSGKPVTVRLFDPPLHEFLPRTDDDIEDTAASLGLSAKALRLRLNRLSEINPMLGHRGCRLAITYPEILNMQMHALFAGARAAANRQTEPVQLEVMVPFVSSSREVLWLRDQVMNIADKASLHLENQVHFSFGTMIELPRAALRAGEIAHAVDFFSFGTNDLTQTTYGISRDDAPAFLAAYQRKGIYEHDPFVTLDQTGVGELIKLAIKRGRAANPELVVGICGEHAGDPDSLKFFAGLDIDYVSCSPYRVPVARLALAQAQR
ncbi:Pyruvate,phosphate dikinase [hydrothermal vent metagenome]|uniref:pyruvate, phosphate dikinase n=1 Tax=hydrothermal vent metagenome TaxID=652676 RepID=A0A3B0U9K3_9ZZZZ